MPIVDSFRTTMYQILKQLARLMFRVYWRLDVFQDNFYRYAEWIESKANTPKREALRKIEAKQKEALRQRGRKHA